MAISNDHSGCARPEAAVASCAPRDAGELVALPPHGALTASPRTPADDLREEEAVRSEVAVQLAEKVVVLRRQLRRREAEIQALQSGDGGGVAELQRKLAEMETKGALWRQRVKEALRASQRREQALLAENIALQQRQQELQGRLNEAAFRLEAGALRNARRTAQVSRHSQTNESTEEAESGDDDSYGGDAPVVSVAGANTLPPRQPQPSPPSPTARTPSYVVASMESLAAAAAAAAVTPMQPEFLPDVGGKSSLVFPPPPPPFLLTPRGNSNPNGSRTNGSPNCPLEISSCDPDSHAQAAPLIVAVHYNNSEGWSVETKLQVYPGMTVAQLKSHCCSQFNDRYQLQLDAGALCVRYYHEKANRHVVLSAYRELHSFACFQRCGREQIPITLQLATEDHLARLVHDTMNLASVSRLNSPHDRAE
ncbi:uncharacterized protein Tco025E_03680 [Trypanosoma conorhini]|uniref:Uncharacterized protein n=1 Tax=Trypanosoma conorhini TaxID=83891 RepID=A0A422PT34_9TRYP|nr:uncharacterized protein Tco025E_03680 [Trypanosoma conorhini]RNF20922.1 hypothetical protein Tco025E_03680 [Trypanosoma conorhini]